MSKESLRTIIVIIVVSMIAILSFGLVIGQMVIKDYIYETMTVILAFVSLFATMGGAYLGAKVAGDNARKLYEHQKNQNDYEKISKVELVANIKLVEVINHSLAVKNDIELLYVDENDKREFNEIVESIMRPGEVIDGYAKPIIELLEDRETYNGTSGLYKSLIKTYNECNRMKQHIELINIYDTGLGHPEDNSNLEKSEIDRLRDDYTETRNKELVRKDVISTFVEYQFIKSNLDKCIEDIKINISDENKLFEEVKVHKYFGLKYFIKFK
ncbi:MULTISPECIES: hypothetical protein [unclassified Mammaliicoccus]|uniref:hypothetical protein n=1 Tax=unclassified Mammaliicoccus TaxID=2803851 RepID=UPI001EFB0D6E|nr:MULTISPECIES: hypothetical protein [unclassified Mammaliicoccus]